jgi:DtxR family Mn-dependent transcriptional regulator
MKTAISSSVEDYLTAIYRLTNTARAVPPTRLAEFMGLSGPSITLMVRRLADQGLVVKDNGHGVSLTSDGQARALEGLRKHRLAERFLVDRLGFDWGQAHVEAHRFEHALSAEVADALERYLQHPSTCPHGHPIPDRDGQLPPDKSVPLNLLTPGEHGVVFSVDDESQALLDWLREVGLVPGASLEVRQSDPTGTLLLQVGANSVAVGASVATHVFVERVTP